MWSTTDELLAQVIEEVSVGNAGFKRKKPLEVPRPHRTRAAANDPHSFRRDDGSVKVRGHAQMKAYAATVMGVGG